jgi:pimeloyl-ACP methyl ester carboxylesterase
MERCLQAGYACFSYDKPGCGRSTGKFDEKRLRYERAGILLDAVTFLRSHPAVDPKQIGLWGISQAGYVMPLALRESDDIAFMIAVGCAAEDGIEQSAYLVGQQVKCAGHPDSVAVHMEGLFSQVCKAQTYADYAIAAKQLVTNPAVPKDMIAGVLPEERWSPRDSLDESLFNPMEVIEQTALPILAIFGDKDTQVDPIQGEQEYEESFRKAGNTHSRVVLVSDADHSMVISETGCVEERRARSASDWMNQSPEYLNLLEAWLRTL